MVFLKNVMGKHMRKNYLKNLPTQEKIESLDVKILLRLPAHCLSWFISSHVPFTFPSSGSWLLFGGTTASHTVRGLVHLNKFNIFPLTWTLPNFEQLCLGSFNRWGRQAATKFSLWVAPSSCFLSGVRIKGLWAGCSWKADLVDLGRHFTADSRLLFFPGTRSSLSKHQLPINTLLVESNLFRIRGINSSRTGKSHQTYTDNTTFHCLGLKSPFGLCLGYLI